MSSLTPPRRVETRAPPDYAASLNQQVPPPPTHPTARAPAAARARLCGARWCCRPAYACTVFPLPMLPQQVPPPIIRCAPLEYLAVTRDLVTAYRPLEMAPF
jgi:hypothetical protein